MDITRVNKVLSNMEKAGLRQIVVSDNKSLYYLLGIGCEPGERLLSLYLNTDGQAHLFNNRMFPLAEQEGLTLHRYDDTDDYMSMMAAVTRPGPIGIDKFWPAKFLLGLLEKGQGLEPCLGSAPVDDARMLKDSREQELLRRASALNDAAMAYSLAALGQGLSERQMAEQVTANQRSLGADSEGAMDQLICYGEGSSEPHHISGPDHIRPGDTAIFDIFAPVDRYWCDMTRTVFWQKVSDEQRRVYQVVQDANAAAIAAVRPGVPLGDIDRAGRRVIEEAGYGPYFTHRLGHGCGLSVHEPPDCSGASRTLAQPGMCFSVEPGIYLPGRFGVRIEDLVLVHEDGAEVLNKYSKELTVLK